MFKMQCLPTPQHLQCMFNILVFFLVVLQHWSVKNTHGESIGLHWMNVRPVSKHWGVLSCWHDSLPLVKTRCYRWRKGNRILTRLLLTGHLISLVCFFLFWCRKGCYWLKYVLSIAKWKIRADPTGAVLSAALENILFLYFIHVPDA